MGPQTRTCPGRSLHRNFTPRASKVCAMESESNTTAAGKAAGRLPACRAFCRRAGGEASERARSTQVPTLPPLLGKHSPASGIRAPPLRSVTCAATRAAETQAWSRPGVSILRGPSSLYLDGSEQETPTLCFEEDQLSRMQSRAFQSSRDTFGSSRGWGANLPQE